MKRSLVTVVATFVIIGSIVTGATQASAVTSAQLKAKVLSLSNMPAGWIVDNAGGGNVTYTGCMKVLHAPQKGVEGVATAEALYADGSARAFGEFLVGGRGASARFQEVNRVFGHCKEIDGTVGGVRVTGSVDAMSFPAVGSASSAYSASVTVEGFSIEADVVVFEVGRYAGEIVYEDVGQPDIVQVEGFVNEAVAKIEGKPTITPNNVASAGGTFN